MKAKEAENSLSEELWREKESLGRTAHASITRLLKAPSGEGRLLAEERGGLLSGTVRDTQQSTARGERERES